MTEEKKDKLDQEATLMDTVLFEKYLQSDTQLSSGVIRSYKYTVQDFLSGKPDINSPQDYNFFITAKGVKKTRFYVYYALRHYIQFKYRKKRLQNMLLDKIMKPKPPKTNLLKRKYLTEDEMIDVVNRLRDKKHRVVAIIQMMTGLRAMDVMRLERENVYPEEYHGRVVLRLVTLAKGSKPTTVFIHDEMCQMTLIDYMCGNFGYKDYVFVTLSGLERSDHDFEIGNLQHKNYTRYHKDLMHAEQMAGLDKNDFATHDFRRCFARRVWDKYKDVNILKDMLGHSYIETTMKYLKTSGLSKQDHLYEIQTGDKISRN